MQVTKSNDGHTIVSFTIFTSALTRITRELRLDGIKAWRKSKKRLGCYTTCFLLNKKMLVACNILMEEKIAPSYWIFLLFPRDYRFLKIYFIT